MNSTGKNSISESTMFDVMSTERVFNRYVIATHFGIEPALGALLTLTTFRQMGSNIFRDTYVQ